MALGMDHATFGQFYSAFRDMRPCWPFIACALPLGAIASAGIVLNAAVVYVTLRNKTLRGTVNILLALCSCSEILHLSGHFAFMFSAFSGLNFIDYSLAVHLCTVQLFGLGTIAPLITFTGIDRLISVIWLTFPKRVNMRIYIGSIVLTCCALSSCLVCLVYKEMADCAFKSTGYIGELFQGSANTFYTDSSLACNSATIAIYVLTGLIIRYRTVPESNKAASVNRRTFRSLVLITLFTIGGYLLMAVSNTLWFPHLGTYTQQWFCVQVVGLAVNASGASNAVILYTTSSSYRKAFRAEFPRVFNCNVTQSTKTQKQVPVVNNFVAIKD